MTDLRELYQSVILDHNRVPRNYGALPDADASAQGSNPLCGDEVTVWVKMDGDRIADVRFVGSGCAISKASASMMTAAVKGSTTAEAASLGGRFQALVTGQTPRPEPTDQALGRLAVFAGVSRYPVRVKCATLAWHALRSALDGIGGRRGQAVDAAPAPPG